MYVNIHTLIFLVLIIIKAKFIKAVANLFSTGLFDIVLTGLFYKMLSNDESVGNNNFVTLAWKRLTQQYQKILDDCTPHVAGRWIFAVLLVFIFLCRVFIAQVISIFTILIIIIILNNFFVIYL